MISKIKNILIQLTDTWEIISGIRNSMIPPERIVYINGGDAKKIGETFLQYFINLGNLKRESDVLDVGSGFGRMAVPLTGYLSKKSKYEGIELLADGVNWCAKKITPKFKNFNFRRIDIKNGRYNPDGKYLASEYKFPFEDNSFDFIILTSVFTHMLPNDLENYLSEISRVLKPEAKCFITYFILNNDSVKHIEEGKSNFNLKFYFDECRIESKEDPEYVIAYKEAQLRFMYEKFNLKITSINYGNWCGRDNYLDFQDIVVAEKIVVKN